MQQRNVVRLAPVENSSESREKGRSGSGLAAEGLEAEMGQDTLQCSLMQISAAAVRPPPVSQVQQLLREERTVRRPVSCGGKSPKEKSALAPVKPLLRCGSRLR